MTPASSKQRLAADVEMFRKQSLNLQKGKALLWAVLVLLFMGALAAYWYFNPAQQPDWVAKRMPTDPGAEIALYRWQNPSGEWTVSSELPPEGVEFEVVSYRHDTNVMPPVNQENED